MSANLFTTGPVIDPFASIRSLLQIGAHDQALKWLETRLRMVPQGSDEQISGRILLSEILLSQGDAVAALETLEEVVAAYPDNREARARLGDLKGGLASGWRPMEKQAAG